MLPVPLDPLEKVPSLAELHHNEQLPCLSDRHCVQDLDNMSVVYLSLDLDLEEREGNIFHRDIQHFSESLQHYIGSTKHSVCALMQFLGQHNMASFSSSLKL